MLKLLKNFPTRAQIRLYLSSFVQKTWSCVVLCFSVSYLLLGVVFVPGHSFVAKNWKIFFLLDKPLLGCFRRVFCKIKQILSKVKLWRCTTNMKLCFNVTDLAAFALLRIKALWRGDLTSELMKFVCEGYLWLHHHFSRITDKSTWDDDWPIARNLENSAV